MKRSFDTQRVSFTTGRLSTGNVPLTEMFSPHPEIGSPLVEMSVVGDVVLK